jgi:hypothetical protein
MKNERSYAIITPSFAPDFERCKLLCSSLVKYVKPPYKHYLIVDQRDLDLFKQLKTPENELIAVESVLPNWIMRLPFARKWWFNFKGLPIRNWIVQQIVKLSMAEHVHEDVFVFIDSDVAFIRSFDFHTFEHGSHVRLFKIPGGGNIESHYKWHRAAAKLLGISPQDYFGARYIGNVVTWRRENVLKLHQRIAEISGRPWIDAVARQWNLSEYILYGVFADQVLKGESGHYDVADNICHEYWTPKPMDRAETDRFVAGLKRDQVAVMVSAKAGVNLDQYRDILIRCENKSIDDSKDLNYIKS